tara:strand:+ start:379 stop:552 length:174 start_codon:yes stop_codon:yes gene_type:complete
MTDITSLQLDIDLFLNGEFSVSTSALGGPGIDLHDGAGYYLATYDDVDDATHHIFKD